MGCFCSKESSDGRVCDDDISDPSLPTIMSIIHGNRSMVLQLSDGLPAIVRSTREFPRDGMGNIMLSQGPLPQVIPVQDYAKSFAFVRGMWGKRFFANVGDVVFVAPYGSFPPVVLIAEGCELNVPKVRMLLDKLTDTLSGIGMTNHDPVSVATTRWGGNFCLH